MSGPIPKREAERRRRNKTTESGVSLEVEKIVVDEGPTAPLPMSDHWHDDAKEFYRACINSVQSQFYEQSDWAALKMACETQSRLLKPQPMKMVGEDGSEVIEWVVQPIKGADLNGLSKIWSLLMVTEGDRRRLRLEIERKAGEVKAPATAEQVVQSRAGLFSVKGGKA